MRIVHTRKSPFNIHNVHFVVFFPGNHKGGVVRSVDPQSFRWPYRKNEIRNSKEVKKSERTTPKVPPKIK